MRSLVLVAFLAACSGGSRVDDVVALTGDATHGATVYAQNCEVCHGPNGTGGYGYPALIGIVAEEGPDEVVSVVLEGEEEMPSFADLADQDIADLLAYLDESI